MVYHPGRVLNVFPGEGKTGETAATIRFWDSNLHTVRVSREISSKIKQGDMVLVDYYPISERLNRPRMVAVKKVSKRDEKDLWSHYQDFLKMKKKAIMAKKRAEIQVPPPSNVGVG
jgi:hypothetical protein